jgi:predicted transcriptional regulator
MGTGRPAAEGPSDAEVKVLEVLWKRGPSTVRDALSVLQSEGTDWAYNTVYTLLERLQKKDYVACDETGYAYVYRATATPDAFLGERIRANLEKAAKNAAEPAPQHYLGQALVETLSPNELGELREFLDKVLEDRRAERKRKKASPGGH